MSIEVNKLLKVYGEQKAVNDISFSVAKGEIVGFLGPNGAGKSTTMKILTGYLNATSGSANVCGIDVNVQPELVKSKVGYLPESNPLYYDMYIKEYLGFIVDVHKVKNKKQAIANMIDLVGLGLEQSKKIGQLSKGYKQRVGLAAALIYDPEVLILDEPTTGLDPNQIIEIREVIKSQGANKTVLFSSHILQEVEAICNRIIIINKGTIVADDSLLNLQSNGSESIVVEFSAPVNTGVFEQLSAVSRVQSTGGNRYRLQVTNPDVARRQLMETALAQNLDIVSISNESKRLEAIFSSLTTF